MWYWGHKLLRARSWTTVPRRTSSRDTTVRGHWRLYLSADEILARRNLNPALRKQANCYKRDEVCNLKFCVVKTFWKFRQVRIVQEAPKTSLAIAVIFGCIGYCCYRWLTSRDGRYGPIAKHTMRFRNGNLRGPGVRTHLKASSLWTSIHTIKRHNASVQRREASNSPTELW